MRFSDGRSFDEAECLDGNTWTVPSWGTCVADATCSGLPAVPSSPQEGWANLIFAGTDLGPCLARSMDYETPAPSCPNGEVSVGRTLDGNFDPQTGKYEFYSVFVIEIDEPISSLQFVAIFSHTVNANEFSSNEVTIAQGPVGSTLLEVD